MADYRDFHVVSEEENNENKGNFRFRIVKHRLAVGIRVIIVAAIVVLLAALIVTRYRNQIYTGMTVVSHCEKISLDSNAYLRNQGSIITYSRDGISASDGEGKVLWNLTYEMQKPIVHQTDGIVAVCDHNGHIIYMINASGKVTQIDTNLPIRDFAVAKEERLAVILEDVNNSWVNLYDSAGSKIVEIKATMSKTGYPLAVALSGEVMGVSYFYVDGETMRNSVTFYNFGGIGENTTDHIVSSYDYADAVVPVIGFMSSDTCFALADNRLMFYGGSKKPVSTSDTLINESIVGAYYGDTDIGLVFYDTSGEHKYRLDIYDTSGKKTVSYPFDIDFKDIIIHKGQIFIYNETQCIVLDESGREKFEGTFEDKVLSVSTTDSNKRYITVTRTAIETISFE
jgi:hypothetical protein